MICTTEFIKGDNMKKTIHGILVITILFTVLIIGYRGIGFLKTKKMNDSIRKVYNQDIDKINHSSEINNKKIVFEHGNRYDLTRLKISLLKEDIINIPNNYQTNNGIKKEIEEKFDKLLGINKDIIGWINIPNTVIDYPVVKTTNNDYYLNHNILKEKSTSGSIFLDFRNEIEEFDRNSILYGHNMKNGTMFKDLMKYKDEEFFKENDIISFSTIYEDTKWEIFSAYVTDTNFYYIQVNFENDKEYSDFLNTIKAKSMFYKDIELDGSEEILTLSTCSYEFNDARFVIHGKKVNEKVRN